MKKSLFTLFTSLTVCGLLLVWSANAMTYTVNWNSTRIEIQKNKLNDTNTINRWVTNEGNIIFSESSSGCSLDRINSEDYILCEKSYTDWENNHTVTISNSRNIKFETVYLNNANIKSISNFDWFTRIGTLHLEWNSDITLQNSTFQWLTTLSSLILSENNLNRDWQNTFQPSLSNLYNKETNSIQLRTNWYTTIPTEIWNSRNNYRIKLSDDIGYWDGRYEIDLSNNPINFVGITNYNQSNNTHNFERFGYFWDEGTPIYQYKIYDENNNPVIWFNTSETSASVDPSNPIDNFNPLKPGEYKFEVCLATSTICDHTLFTVDYDEYITISSPQNNQEYNIQDNITWERWRSWNYPEELLSWYEYIIEKWHIEIARWTISLNEIGSCYFQYENHEDCAELNINNLLWNDLEDWVYTLTVYLTDKNNEHIQTTDYWGSTIDVSSSVNFTINTPVQDPTIQITRPSDTETEAITYFSWTSTIPDWNEFTSYTREIKRKSDDTTVTSGVINNENKKWFEIDDLDNWEYTFNVKLNYKRDNTDYSAIDTRYANGTKSFTVEKTYPSIKINRPLNNETGATTYFRWTPTITPWFTFNNYEWTISKNGTTIITKQYTNIEQTSYETGWLNNWEYTFNIKMNYTQDSNNQSGYAIDRDYASNGGSKTFTISKPNTLNITSPASNWAVLTESENTFSRNWTTSNTFIKYTYTLTWNDYSTGWSFDRINQNSFTIRNLRDGNYTLKVTMETNNGNETDIRTFRVNTSAWVNLTITSPNKTRYTWNYIKTVPMNFTWNWWGSTLISKYTYKLTNTSTNKIIDEGSVNKNNAGSYSVPAQSLPSGTYKFEVTMLDSDGSSIIPTVSYTFNIIIPSYLEILTPSSWQLNIKNVNFTWSWFAEFQDHYKYELKKINSSNSETIITWNSNTQAKNFSLQNLHNGKYTFSVEIMDNTNHQIIKKEKTFRIPDDLDLYLDISDWNSSVTTLKSRKWIFSWGWKSEDFAWYSYSIQGTTFKNESYLYTWTSEWVTTGSITLSNLSTWKYRFHVKMLNASGWIITWKYIDFNVVIPASLKITSPTSWSTVSSSNATFKWDWYSDVITRYEYSLTSSGWYNYNWFTTTNTFNRNDLTNWNYTLVVRLASGTNFVAQDTVHFTVSIPKKTSWGGWWWSSSKSHPTNDLSVSITNDEPTTNERVEVVVDVNDKYTGKVDFTKMQYYSFDEEKRVDIPVTSKNYVKDYSDDAKLGYVKFDSSDDWEKNLSEFLKFSQPGNYRIHVEDKDWYNDYVQFYVWKWNNKAQLTTSKEPQDEDEYYIARSCKKYKIEYLNNLGVYTSPNLKKDEYFISKDYFKRYIDSKNKRTDWCPTNVWWITTTYKDSSNSSDRYTAPNGKVYFINWQNWIYSSTELDKELNGAKKFSTINDLKYFIRDRNPFISMAKLWPITIK